LKNRGRKFPPPIGNRKEQNIQIKGNEEYEKGIGRDNRFWMEKVCLHGLPLVIK
jgi:hypothetical protein